MNSLNPFLAWSRLALKASATLMTSGQVVAYRMNGMVRAGATPGPADRHELALMGREKIEATAASVQAMGAQWITINGQLATLALQQAFAGAAAMMALASSRTPQAALQSQTRLARGTSVRSTATVALLSNSGATLARRGLAPIRSRVSRNAKRLVKR